MGISPVPLRRPCREGPEGVIPSPTDPFPKSVFCMEKGCTHSQTDSVRLGWGRTGRGGTSNAHGKYHRERSMTRLRENILQKEDCTILGQIRLLGMLHHPKDW